MILLPTSCFTETACGIFPPWLGRQWPSPNTIIPWNNGWNPETSRNTLKRSIAIFGISSTVAVVCFFLAGSSDMKSFSWILDPNVSLVDTSRLPLISGPVTRMPDSQSHRCAQGLTTTIWWLWGWKKNFRPSGWARGMAGMKHRLGTKSSQFCAISMSKPNKNIAFIRSGVLFLEDWGIPITPKKGPKSQNWNLEDISSIVRYLLIHIGSSIIINHTHIPWYSHIISNLNIKSKHQIHISIKYTNTNYIPNLHIDLSLSKTLLHALNDNNNTQLNLSQSSSPWVWSHPESCHRSDSVTLKQRARGGEGV